jgi:hypothetical protein
LWQPRHAVLRSPVEVRGVLLAAGDNRGAWDALLGEVGQERALALLDLVSAVSLKLERPAEWCDDVLANDC